MSERETTDALLERVKPRATEMRSWGVDESKVDYDLPMGDAWLIVHLADAVDALRARLVRLEQEMQGRLTAGQPLVQSHEVKRWVDALHAARCDHEP